MAGSVKALCFDVFGTLVDWRGSIIARGPRFDRALGREVDWAAFADAWRGLYQPSMEEVRSGRREWTVLDRLHRESLERLIGEFSLKRPDEATLERLNRAWHELDPWPDVARGMARLKSKYILAALSNGNVALLVDLARHAGLPWDAILGAEPARQYKPRSEPYLATASMLGLAPCECVMVAAHNGDLVKAASLGFRTAFIARPREYGPRQRTDLKAENDYDFVAADLNDLADRMGCR